MLGQINLPPAFGAALFPDSHPDRHADIRCHPFMVGLVFALYLAHPLSGTERESCESPFSFFATRVLLFLSCSSSANQERRYRLHRTDGRLRDLSRRRACEEASAA